MQKHKETACASLREQKTVSSNAVGHKSENIDVDCEAVKCIL